MSETTIAASLALLSLLASTLLTGWIRGRAIKRGMLDWPNQRSSHTVPTPRGGGLSIVIVNSVAILTGVLLDWVPATFGAALIPGYLAIAWVGWLDDLRGVPPVLRLLVHLAATAWVLLVMVVVAFEAHSSAVISLSAALAVAFVWIALTWAVNLFNFMDGIDGIAAAQALFTGAIGVVVATLQDVPGLAFLLGGVSAAAAGFLVWNWQPAKIFMGDVGSGSLGFLLAAAPVVGVRFDALWPWVILWAAFFVDSTVTLLRRALLRQRIVDAHRSHAYQILSRRWNSHSRVTLAYSLVNVTWVAPLAIAAAVQPQAGPWLALVAALPMIVLALRVGAGRSDA